MGNNLENQYPDIQPFYKTVFDATLQDTNIKEALEFTRNFFEEWCGNFLHPLADEFTRQGKEVNLLYRYLTSQSLTFDWLAHSLIFANYQTVLCELRRIIENSFLMYSTDIAYSSNKIEQKLEKVNEIIEKETVPRGKALFENSGYLDWQQGYNLYRLLNKHDGFLTTSSIETAIEEKNGSQEIKKMEYNRELFVICSKMWREAAKILVSLAVDSGKKSGLIFSESDSGALFKIW
jgi:hypothetical protein